MKALSELKIIQRIPGNLKFTEKISVEKENIRDQQKYLIMQKEKGFDEEIYVQRNKIVNVFQKENSWIYLQLNLKINSNFL